MAHEPTETTLNLPQLAVLLVIGFLAVRWMLTSRDSSSPSPSSSSQGASVPPGRRPNMRHVETIASMFPQLDRRAIMWDLQSNGNNLQMTTERVLMGRGLETPPQSFQPQLPQEQTTQTRQPDQPKKPTQPDLIQRYNLSQRLDDASETSESARNAWSNSKNERQSTLQKRREEMILAARRKLLEQEGKKL